jgi:hypothetical protein
MPSIIWCCWGSQRRASTVTEISSASDSRLSQSARKIEPDPLFHNDCCLIMFVDVNCTRISWPFHWESICQIFCCKWRYLRNVRNVTVFGPLNANFSVQSLNNVAFEYETVMSLQQIDKVYLSFVSDKKLSQIILCQIVNKLICQHYFVWANFNKKTMINKNDEWQTILAWVIHSRIIIWHTDRQMQYYYF